MSDNSRPHRKEIAMRVKHLLESEHGEVFPTEKVERSVDVWLERQYANLIEDAVELLTSPRFGHSSEFYAELKKLTQPKEGLLRSKRRI